MRNVGISDQRRHPPEGPFFIWNLQLAWPDNAAVHRGNSRGTLAGMGFALNQFTAY